ALDPESEYEINRDIAQAAQGKTVVMISHRLSTTKDADKIVLIEGGEVREQGSHTELMASGGRYAHLFNIQASEYVSGVDGE
ncbi:MAG: ABC transporter ATP-binding protein, partial [Oscillospiraceae bacterium]|nr:ABC transporter ATP-binding protein [Oscillospiraceae bacterium]